MRLRRKTHQTEAASAEAVVTAALGKRSGGSLATRARSWLVRRQLRAALSDVPVVAALAIGLAVGILIGATVALAAIVTAAREA